MSQHVAIMSSKKIADAILSGQKTIEGRLTEAKIPPFGIIKHNDDILIKVKGGLVFGEVSVDNVLFYEQLNGEAIGRIRREYSDDMQVDDTYWQQHSNAKYASIIFLKNPRRYLSPIKLVKKDRRPWVVLD